VAAPGFYLGVRSLSTGGGGGRKSLKVLKVEVKVFLSVFLAIFLLKLCLKLIACEASEEKRYKLAFWA